MSINHISTDLQETLWWQQQHQQPMKMEPTQDSSSSKPNKTSIPQQYSWPSHLYHHQLWVNSYNSQESASIFSAQNHPTHHTFNLNQEDTVVVEEPDLDDQSTTDANQEPDQDGQLDKEPMFEKPLTPSDVGKLNRLVIPKQHAEKHFPLGGESGDKGLLLSFEDESGKCWRFRYSYWTSSQSYVLTKGWSRYVKEKRLDAGDVIQFERHRRDSERVFIGWRRRGGGSGGCNRGLYSSTNHPYPLVDVQNHDAGSVVVENQATPVGNSKRLRLFGVNLECQLDESEPQATHRHRHHDFYSHTHHPPSYSSNRHTHMDITFSQDVNQMMRNRQG